MSNQRGAPFHRESTTVLERVAAADGTEFVLCAGEASFQIRVDGRLLMDSRHHRTEQFLAHLAVRYLPDGGRPRVLVGGLGMGFTLRAALDALPGSALVDVAESVGAVIRWNRGPLVMLTSNAVGDPRVRVIHDDVATVLGGWRERYDAIILDVDNGPHDLALPANVRLYGKEGLKEIIDALRPGGVATIWSAEPAPDLVERLLQLECRPASPSNPGGYGGGTVELGPSPPRMCPPSISDRTPGVCAWSETVQPMEDDDRVRHSIVVAVRYARTCPLPPSPSSRSHGVGGLVSRGPDGMI